MCRISKQEVFHSLSFLRLDWFVRCHCSVFPNVFSVSINEAKSSLSYFSISSHFCGVFILSHVDCRFVLSLSFFVALLFFGGFHVWLVFNDQTTIETSFNCQRFTLHGRSAKKIQYYRNWCNVMDTNPFLWLIPVHDKSFHFAWDFMEVGNTQR